MFYTKLNKTAPKKPHKKEALCESCRGRELHFVEDFLNIFDRRQWLLA